jgi:6-phosphofructokinase 1
MRIGILTAGGDAPGLNAAVRAVGRRALADGHEVWGVRNGWSGLIGEVDAFALERPDLAGILTEGGTLLGSVRFNLDKPPGGREQVLENITRHYDAVVTMGGDGTMGVAHWLAERGAPIVGVPKTLDNDLAGTAYCIGFDTAVSIVSEALDRLHTTAASHHRVMVLETMGRSTGWVATMGGLAGGADLIVIPEFEVTYEEIAAHVARRHSEGRTFSIVVVAEGVSLQGLGGHDVLGGPDDGTGRVQVASHNVGQHVARQIHHLTGFETRATVLGHVQRGGSPTAYDRIWATHVGSAAYDAVCEGDFGSIPVVCDGRVMRARIEQVIAERHLVPRELWELCAHFF